MISWLQASIVSYLALGVGYITGRLKHDDQCEYLIPATRQARKLLDQHKTCPVCSAQLEEKETVQTIANLERFDMEDFDG